MDQPLNFPDTQGMRWIHRLLLARYGLKAKPVLNAVALQTMARQVPSGAGHARSDPPPPPSATIAADLMRLVQALRGEAIDPDGKHVDYGRLKASPTYLAYRQCAAWLRSFDPMVLESHDARLAFWINLYNALIVDAVIQFGVRRSVNEVPGFFWRAAYDVGGLRLGAFDVEYGILRANGSHPAIPGPHFGKGDPRRRYSLARLDPRVHFALVCAARSCPPISFYSAEAIDRQLDLATRAFVNHGGVEIDRSAGRVRLSKIFQWYAPDFGGQPLGIGDKQPLLDFIAPYLLDETDQSLMRQGEVKVSFQPYDWTLNNRPI